MAKSPPETWPDALLMLGDQIYADDLSPAMKAVTASREDTDPSPKDEVYGFSEFALAYREAWSEPAIRWLLSTVPTLMVFDDHEIHAEWKISQQWLDEKRREPWYERRVTDGLVAYWIYQHLGNLTPGELAQSDVLDRVCAADDAAEVLRAFARDADRQAGASRWSFCRDLGHSRLIVIDSRAGRELAPGQRRMVDDEEWAWIEEHASGDFDHLLLASSVPFLLGHGLHHLEAWNEAICDGAWGRWVARLGERLRRVAVLDHWASFQASFRRVTALLETAATGGLGAPPRSLLLLSGDVHHSYLAEVGFRVGTGARSAVWQVVCSPYRKELAPREKLTMRFANSRGGAPARPAGWLCGPEDLLADRRRPYENHVATLDLAPGRAELLIETTAGSNWRRPDRSRASILA